MGVATAGAIQMLVKVFQTEWSGAKFLNSWNFYDFYNIIFIVIENIM